MENLQKNPGPSSATKKVDNSTAKMNTIHGQSGSSCAIKQVDNSYGKFLVKLAELLTLRIVLDLATYFQFPEARCDELQRADYPGQLLVSNMQERGLISFNDITPLLEALKDLCLLGVMNDALSLFTEHTSNNSIILGKLKILQNGLKAVYKIFYKSIRPIPYIRDKLYCVDEVFVDSGIQLRKGSDKSIPSQFAESSANKTGNIELKSYRDIFDSNVLLSKRIIVEGEPGYGKSTLTLQAAYDWCTAKSSSPLAGFEVFILLQFRLLRDIKSIYKAIKLLALPRDCILTENDIKQILASCTRVVIVLDGFDEYPDMTNDLDSDMMEITKGKMFANQKTIIFTRTGCLPRNIDPDTMYVRMTGFDDAARDQYIQVAVRATSDLADEIKRDLDENPVMSDLCQVPLFFVMFAHLSSDSKDVLKCDSVTQFFTYMLRCFYDHMRKKTDEDRQHDTLTRETADKSGLCKLAFKALTGEKQTLVWEKEELVGKAGKECSEELVKIGILVEEELLSDETDSFGFKYVTYKPVIRFYHKTFTEWYAAQHLGELAKNFLFFRNLRLGRILQRIDPQDVQFVFRFACGLNPVTFKSIFKYLEGFNANVATLCIFEAARNVYEIKGIVQRLCSKQIELEDEDSRLLQRSKIQLLTTASGNQIPISSVKLLRCFQYVDLEEECVCLSSGLQLPRLDTLQELVLEFWHPKDLRDQARDILDYSARCVGLKSLK
ncbi:Nucleotide-binding oligomerization domain-containing protein 2 [Holothuria leucospilota]|uniref:Nucleotide-binding oligomerization domain-containing protein 2 n=1 Tax=Holothuria leucospilota TaxID=206669 RepID=A0A9Q1CS35_HOLLE|nr:Nucleotide-binding oligomerization domain-containing protein 2 [Holothuria leucospilota]